MTLATHPAACAWLAVRPGGRPPLAVEPVKLRRASVFRLRGAGPEGRDVIAKSGSRSRLEVERLAYEEVLPALGLASLALYGWRQEGEAAWLFLEDAGPEEEDLLARREARLLAARWLARLHAATEASPFAALLPDRSTAYHLGSVRSAREALERHRAHPALSPAHRATLARLAGRCERIEERWGALEAISRTAPEAVVHGDFVAKNLRLRRGRSGAELLVFDWEVMGYGARALDLVSLRRDGDGSALATYGREAGVETHRLEALAEAGRLLWLLGVLAGGLGSLEQEDPGRVHVAMAKLEVYDAWLAEAEREVAGGG